MMQLDMFPASELLLWVGWSITSKNCKLTTWDLGAATLRLHSDLFALASRIIVLDAASPSDSKTTSSSDPQMLVGVGTAETQSLL